MSITSFIGDVATVLAPRKTPWQGASPAYYEALELLDNGRKDGRITSKEARAVLGNPAKLAHLKDLWRQMTAGEQFDIRLQRFGRGARAAGLSLALLEHVRDIERATSMTEAVGDLSLFWSPDDRLVSR